MTTAPELGRDEEITNLDVARQGVRRLVFLVDDQAYQDDIRARPVLSFDERLERSELGGTTLRCHHEASPFVARFAAAI
jgi:hypothetical protein